MGLNEAAQALAVRLRETGLGMLSLRREEIREAFGIGRLTDSQGQAIDDALDKIDVFLFPPLTNNTRTIRLYDVQHPMGLMVLSVLAPDKMPETALRQFAISLARQRAGEDLRSDDVPWLVAFDLFLQVVTGRESEEWEELRDDRHPVQLARELADSLGFDPEMSDEDFLHRIAVAVCAHRPRQRSWVPSDFVPEGDKEADSGPLFAAIKAAQDSQQKEHENLLHHAARLLLGTDEIPQHPVELGLLGLRHRRENTKRTQG